MLVGMSIRVLIENAEGRFWGYVDVGGGSTSVETMPVAKQALVLMAVTVNDSWKIPVGYFLCMSAEERSNVIKDCLIRLHGVGVRVVSVTCDGPTVNFSMLTALGANLTIEGMNPSFPHPANPSQKVHVILDVT